MFILYKLPIHHMIVNILSFYFCNLIHSKLQLTVNTSDLRQASYYSDIFCSLLIIKFSSFYDSSVLSPSCFHLPKLLATKRPHRCLCGLFSNYSYPYNAHLKKRRLLFQFVNTYSKADPNTRNLIHHSCSICTSPTPSSS